MKMWDQEKAYEKTVATFVVILSCVYIHMYVKFSETRGCGLLDEENLISIAQKVRFVTRMFVESKIGFVKSLSLTVIQVDGTPFS